MTQTSQPERTTNPSEHASKVGSRRWLMALPFAFFAVVAAVFFYALQAGDPNRLPSALIGKPVPTFDLPAIEGLVKDGKPVPGLSTQRVASGEVSIVNVWASWCIPCHQEHPYLTAAAERSGAPLYGLNNKDKPAAARRFLGRYGNPFVAIGDDRDGRAAIEWGVYGVPETFIIDKQGKIAYRHVGPIGPDDVTRIFLPKIEKLRAAQ